MNIKVAAHTVTHLPSYTSIYIARLFQLCSIFYMSISLVNVCLHILDPYGMFDINEDSGQIRYIGPMYEGMRTVTVVVLVSMSYVIS